MSAQNVGLRRTTAPRADGAGGFPVLVVYPTEMPEISLPFGPYAMSLSENADVVADRASLPLVAISHGTGSSPFVFRDLASHLAREGFAVALFEHPGNSRSDNSLANTTMNLEYRPRDLRSVVDVCLSDKYIGPYLIPDRAGIVGHSIGGYTALALAGGKPTSIYEEPSPRAIRVVHDARVRAIALLAPAAAWFAKEGALDDVRVPIYLRCGEKDEAAPPFHGDFVRNGIRDSSQIDHAIIPNAGHFAFLTPFPAAMAGPHFPPSNDPPGFDRVSFLSAFYSEITAFLRRHLAV